MKTLGIRSEIVQFCSRLIWSHKRKSSIVWSDYSHDWHDWTSYHFITSQPAQLENSAFVSTPPLPSLLSSKIPKLLAHIAIPVPIHHARLSKDFCVDIPHNTGGEKAVIKGVQVVLILVQRSRTEYPRPIESGVIREHVIINNQALKFPPERPSGKTPSPQPEKGR